MKTKGLTTLCLILLLGFGAQAQKVKEKDVIGTWKLVIDIEKEMDDEADDADTILEEIIIKSVSGIVSGVMDNIDIYFEFQRDYDVIISVDAFGDSDEGEGTWYINKRGYLVIEDLDDTDNDHFHIDTDDDEWKLIDGLLVSDDHEDDKNVYMTKVD